MIGFLVSRQLRTGPAASSEWFAPGYLYSPKKIHEKYEDLKKKYDQETFKKLNNERLLFKDQKGRFWGIGARTGNWIRFDNENIRGIAAAPPARLQNIYPLALEPSKALQMTPPTTPHVCMQCGAPVMINKKFCTKCGSPVGKTVGLKPVVPSLRRCPNPQCGTPVPAGKKFCQACGTRIRTTISSEPVSCPKCGQRGEIGKKFCKSCGSRLAVRRR
jgi:hypothetical protein